MNGSAAPFSEPQAGWQREGPHILLAELCLPGGLPAEGTLAAPTAGLVPSGVTPLPLVSILIWSYILMP